MIQTNNDKPVTQGNNTSTNSLQGRLRSKDRNMFCNCKIINEFNQKGKKKMIERAYTQYSLPAVIKKFGIKGDKAGFNEFNQLHKRTVFNPIFPNNLTSEQ